jgi:molybdenum cofactor biosynthesis enzyme MoaA
LFAWRQENLAFLLKQGHFLKLNYVWSSPDDNIDLSKMLQEIPRAPVVLNLLDDLNQDIGPSRLLDLLKTLRGPWNQQWVEPDPNSLSTLKLQWEDGLLVEIKDQQLGQVAPWKACQTCPVKSRCKEGIHALRLTHQGLLKPCMDRPELQLNLKALVGQDYAADAWNHFVGAV